MKGSRRSEKACMVRSLLCCGGSVCFPVSGGEADVFVVGTAAHPCPAWIDVLPPIDAIDGGAISPDRPSGVWDRVSVRASLAPVDPEGNPVAAGKRANRRSGRSGGFNGSILWHPYGYTGRAFALYAVQ